MKHFFDGLLCGILNGFFGSGGGVAAVPLIEHEQRLIHPELSPADAMKHAHADSVALIFVYNNRKFEERTFYYLPEYAIEK